MNLNVWSKGMYSSSNICLEGCTAEYLSSFQPGLVPSTSDVSGASVTSPKGSESRKIPLQRAYYSSGDADSSLICSSQLDLSPSRDAGHLSTKRHPSPGSNSFGHHDCNLNSGHQAKRARVENIIKVMGSSPGMHYKDLLTNQHGESDPMESERFQELPLHHEGHRFVSASHSLMSKKQPESQQQQHLRQLRTKFNCADGEINTMTNSNQEKYPTSVNSPETSQRDACTDSHSECESSSSRKSQTWKKVNCPQSKPERIKLMADVLKYELSRAVSRSVDSIFRSMPLLQTPSHDHSSLHSSDCKDNRVRPSCFGKAKGQIEDVQTEALSLVVQKPGLKRGDSIILKPGSRDHNCSKLPFSFTRDSTLHEEEPAQENHNTACQNSLRCSDAGQAKFEPFDAHWNSLKVRTKVNSRTARCLSVDPKSMRSLCLPHLKTESNGPVKNNLYMLNEGLTTSHLKKAKLMFFYTRYPSSQILKMCFHDVQFSRCITSQLIKWFSNFREFYYIQMEKFARHALSDGVTDVRALTVGRESELFRNLNMHYNKASDFQVPDRFLEVAEITLREFYIAISVGKDRDPSWKKAIYKLICKLDSDVPAEFKN